jgi:hypothetical protein
LRNGARDGDYGSSFAAKCMRLAIWVQRVVAPILYRTVTIYSAGQGRSLFLAIARNVDGKGYSPRALINSLVIEDDAQTKDPVFSTVIAEIIIALNQSNYKRLKIPLHLMEFAPLPTTYSPLLPYSVAYAGLGSLFPNYTYAAVVKLRLIDFSPQMWEIRGLLAVAKGVTHVAFKLTSNSWASMGLIESVTRVAHIQRLVVVVQMPPEEKYLSQLLRMKEEPPTWLEGTYLSKAVIWEWSDEVEDLLAGEDDELLWKAAEDATMQQNVEPSSFHSSTPRDTSTNNGASVSINKSE